MTTYNSVFKRVEKKYRIGEIQRAAVQQAATAYMAPDAYGRTRVTSLYLDTPERAMIARSVEKPLYKEKLRLRAYGDAAGELLMAAFAAGPFRREANGLPLSDADVETRVAWAAEQVKGRRARTFGRATVDGGNAAKARAGSVTGVCEQVESRRVDELPNPFELPVFFGIKKKFKGVVYKRRLALSLPAAIAFVSGLGYEQACTRWPLVGEAAAAALTPQTRQIARELTATMDRHLPLVPSMGIACDRVAWAVREDAPMADAGFRITFDDRIEYLDCFAAAFPSQLDGEPWREIIAPGETLMEIKCAGAYPKWLVEVLSANRIYPASFTKYGNAYQMASPAAPTKAVGAPRIPRLAPAGKDSKPHPTVSRPAACSAAV